MKFIMLYSFNEVWKIVMKQGSEASTSEKNQMCVKKVKRVLLWGGRRMQAPSLKKDLLLAISMNANRCLQLVSDI